MTPSSDTQLRNVVRSLVASAETAPILQLGEPALRSPAVPYSGQLDDDELAQLLALMRRTMHAAPGVGLAAPQIGVPLQLAVLEDRFDVESEVAAARERAPLPYFAIINPSYRPAGPDTVSFYEGCLSFAGFQGVVERYRRVELEYQRPDGTRLQECFTGWQARIVQHETDHLAGTVYVDKVNTRSLSGNAEYGRLWADPTIERARRGLGF